MALQDFSLTLVDNVYRLGSLTSDAAVRASTKLATHVLSQRENGVGSVFGDQLAQHRLTTAAYAAGMAAAAAQSFLSDYKYATPDLVFRNIAVRSVSPQSPANLRVVYAIIADSTTFPVVVGA